MIYEPGTSVSEKVKDIEGLDWNEQWDVTTSIGEKYASMTITGIEGMKLYLRTPEIPGYEQLIGVKTMVIDIRTIQTIEKSPSRHVYLYRNMDPFLYWNLVYLSPMEKENIPTDSFDTVLGNLTRRTDTVTRVWGNGVYLYLKCDDFGRYHMYTGESGHFVFIHNF